MSGLFDGLISSATSPEMTGFFLSASLFFAGLVPAIAYKVITRVTDMGLDGE